jgi:hypothetical protein
MSPDDIFAKKITTYLDHGVAGPKVRHRIQAAARTGGSAGAPRRPCARERSAGGCRRVGCGRATAPAP